VHVMRDRDKINGVMEPRDTEVNDEVRGRVGSEAGTTFSTLRSTFEFGVVAQALRTGDSRGHSRALAVTPAGTTQLNGFQVGSYGLFLRLQLPSEDSLQIH
jgi:hypothetical protein